MTPQQKQVLKVVTNMLREHFNSSQILVTHVKNDNVTCVYKGGHGDMFARQGAAQHFLMGMIASQIPLDIPEE